MRCCFYDGKRRFFELALLDKMQRLHTMETTESSVQTRYSQRRQQRRNSYIPVRGMRQSSFTPPDLCDSIVIEFQKMALTSYLILPPPIYRPVIPRVILVHLAQKFSLSTLLISPPAGCSMRYQPRCERLRELKNGRQ